MIETRFDKLRKNHCVKKPLQFTVNINPKPASMKHNLQQRSRGDAEIEQVESQMSEQHLPDINFVHSNVR